MDPTQLASLLQTETDRVEWKQSTHKPDDILRAVCALANDLGNSQRSGFLLLGVTTKGEVVGVAGSPDVEQRMLADRLQSTRILLTPSCRIEVLEYDQKTVLVVEVDPYPVPPMVTVDGTSWVRVGSTTRRARDADQQRLTERRPEGRQPFDVRPVDTACLDDLVVTELRLAHQNARSLDSDPDTFPVLEEWLTSKQLGRSVRGTWRPNAAAILLVGRSPQTFFPGARVEVVRYAGSGVDADVLWRRSATGTLTDQLDIVWAQLNANIASISAGERGAASTYVLEYPLDALKEFARNLVQHRLYEGTNGPGRLEWFDDRIEFSNPGGPFGHASEGELGAHADYRNPMITAGLVERGYVEQLGRGVRRARLLLERNGNPPLEVTTDGYTSVTVRRRP
ncbi:MAG: putative DNA binding domain-containing protein [Planctomycetota bacterium]